MAIPKTLAGIPRYAIIFGGCLLVLLSWAYYTNQLTPQMQSIVFGGFLVLILLAIREQGKGGITLEQAKKKGLLIVKTKKSEGVITSKGSIKESIEGVTRQRNGIPWYHEVCVEIHGSITNYYVVEINMKGIEIRTTKKDSWKSTDSPHQEIVTPPDIMRWIKEKREIDSRIEDMAK